MYKSELKAEAELGIGIGQEAELISHPKSFSGMKYRDIEYSLVQGIERQLWKWSVTIGPGVLASGQTVTKAEAARRAEKAIDRALSPKPRLVSSRGSDDGTS